MTAEGNGRPSEDLFRMQVRARYERVANGGGSCCASDIAKRSCCGGRSEGEEPSHQISVEVGYSRDEILQLPEGSDLGLGCGNPTAFAEISAGESVLDLGSGAGIDCFLAAQRVGPQGRVLGVDMTPTMVERARSNTRSGTYANVEFRLGEMEHLPIADGSVDVVISNCAINLAPDQRAVYREAFRVLKPGGRLAISDVVAIHPLADEERSDPALRSSCSSGALEVEELHAVLRDCGFDEIQIEPRAAESCAAPFDGQASPGVRPADLRARRPRGD